MKIYKILLITFSTVSIIHCTHQSEEDDDNKASYHIEFEDKNPHGGYGYKVQVSGKSKYQETWKNDKKHVPTSAPISTGTLDYSENNYAAATNEFVPEPLTKPVDNNFAQNSYLSNTATNQYSSKPAYQPSSQNSVSFKSPETNKAPSNSFIPQTKQTGASGQNQHYRKTPTYASVNSFSSYDQQNTLASQADKLNKDPVQFSSSDNFVPINFQESKVNSQNSYIAQNYGSNSQDWKVSAGHYSSKPSLQVMGQYPSNNFDGSSYTGPQVFVESTSGKINHNQFTNHFESKPQGPQVSLPLEADLSNYYLQNPKSEVHNSVTTQTEIPAQIQYYQPVSHFKENTDYKTLSQGHQYVSQVPSVSFTQSVNNPESSNDNIDYSPIKYSMQYASPVNQYSTIEGITNTKDSTAQKHIQYAPQTSSVPSSTQFVSAQEIKHSKGNTIHKSVSSSVNHAHQHHSVPLTKYVPVQVDYSKGNNFYQPSFSTHQYESVPLTQYASHSQDNIVNKPVTLTSQYAPQASSVPLTQYGSQETVKYAPQQNIPSFQVKPSVQIPIDYSQLLQQYPQFSQGPLASLPTEQKEIPQQNLYHVLQQQQPFVNKQVVSYHYKQEFPSTNQTNVSPNTSPNAQYIALNTFTPKDLANTYNTLLSGYRQQQLTGGVNIGNGIPLSPYGAHGNAESGKNVNQILHAPGLMYGYGSNVASGHGLINLNGYTDMATNGYQGGLQLVNTYQRRSSGKVEEKVRNHKKQYVADQKQIE